MNTGSFRKLLYLGVLAGSLSGCALVPHIESDTQGVGSSEVGKVIASGVFLSTTTLERYVTELLHRQHVFEGGNSVERLQAVGFTCVQPKECIYVGSIRSKLIMTDGSVLPGNDQTDNFTVIVSLSDIGHKVTISKTITFNNGQHRAQRL